ncbi:MAG: hypothetical protein G3M78_08765 [Candidatus Nitrohelix vancouverensis]|uniref:Peptidase M10 metallopeptidase domain-containing protein n=1 Tax=Candidatus Nitrohelix vancouverensis TaxID=2705534 RepID=A0A7T0C2R2_9BACT|nr:MAG: hypothetical protein G3M78_08765 [Candidatus Nitrohelix vancouverensis]
MTRHLLVAAVFTIVHLFAISATAEEGKRKFYEYKGNYREEINNLKKDFETDFGYQLHDGERGWTPDEIRKMRTAMDGLPGSFFHMKGFAGFVRMERLSIEGMPQGGEDIPAATFPTFITIFDGEGQEYRIDVADDEPRVEVYNPLFYESNEDFLNIVQHELGHAFDITHGFLSASPEWIAISQFTILNLPPLDARPQGSFLFTFLDDPGVNSYAPVSVRHLPTYSRTNIQEDFANSVAAYIHYPYFKITHPERYQFMKEKLFEGKEYFPTSSTNSSSKEVFSKDFKQALDSGDSKQAKKIVIEASRTYSPEVDEALTLLLKQSAETSKGEEADVQAAQMSCFLGHPEALKIRERLLTEKRVAEKPVFEEVRCRQMSRRNFEENLMKWAPAGLFFYRNEGADMLKLMDPVILTAHARNFSSTYMWKMYVEGQKKAFAEGSFVMPGGGSGSVEIDLQKTALNPFQWPKDELVILGLIAKRVNRDNLFILNSEAASIRFKPLDWFQYVGPKQPKIRVRFPLRLSHLDGSPSAQ